MKDLPKIHAIAGEFTVQWAAFSESDKHTIADCFAIAHGLTKSQAADLVRVFEITQPDIIMGKGATGSYARLADTTQNNKEVLALLIKTYIL
jgi:hypothetical protein